MAKQYLKETENGFQYFGGNKIGADDGKAGCKTFEHTTSAQYSDCLYFLWRDINDFYSKLEQTQCNAAQRSSKILKFGLRLIPV